MSAESTPKHFGPQSFDEFTLARLRKLIPELRGPMVPLPEPRIDADLSDLTDEQLAEMDRVIEQINRDMP